jgi:hypothetical protein
MTALIAWFVMAYGFTNIMVYGSIFQNLRNTIIKWGSSKVPVFSSIFDFISGIITCMMCCSTWVGFFLGFFIYSPSHELFNLTNYISWFFDGLMVSGAVWAINSVIEWFEENRPNKVNL